MKRFAGVELGGTTWVVAIAEGHPQNIVEQISFDTTTPDVTIPAAISWLKARQFDAIGIASFGPVDLNPSSDTYGFITSTPKLAWANTDIVGQFKTNFPGIPVGFETDVNAPALYEVAHGGHGNISSTCYITVGTGVGVGICVDKKTIHGYMHPEAGHCHVPLADEDLKTGFKGVCPFHGTCVEGMVGSHAIAMRSGFDRRELAKIPDDSPVWDSVAHYLAHLCVNLTLTVSPDVIVIGGGISKRSLIFDKIHEKFEKILNHYVKYPPVKQYIKPSFHPQIGLVSSFELARQSLGSSI